jgi:hydroxybutyrate-dimer hydrolase
VQIPRNFDVDKPCILLAPPSGSRGYYGGIAVGEWGLFNGCAVVLPGKGTGTGFHLLGSDTVYDIDGQARPADQVGRGAQFRVAKSGRLYRFLETHPNRVATKHAHSQANSERSWGQFSLKGVEFAFWVLNHHFHTHRFTSAWTMVIASGVSNGAGTAVRALEADHRGLIDGLVVSEPSLNPRKGNYRIKFGDNVPFDPDGGTLYDSISLMGTYAACASLSDSLTGTPFFGAEPIGAPAGARANRCMSLRERGLLAANTEQEQADESLAVLRASGYYEEEDWGIASHEWLNLWRTLQPTYAASYARSAVWENICNVSFAATDVNGFPVPVSIATAASLFATSSGIPATSGINLIADDAANGPILENLAVSVSTGRQDLNFDGAACFRYLSTGNRDVLATRPSGHNKRNHHRLRAGARQLQTKGDLHGVPSIIIHGREDALVFPNYQSRAYYALNQSRRGARSRLSYWEVTPAQHFDTLITRLWASPPVTGPAEFVPLHYYLTEGLDMMLEHLTDGNALPGVPHL